MNNFRERFEGRPAQRSRPLLFFYDYFAWQSLVKVQPALLQRAFFGPLHSVKTVQVMVTSQLSEFSRMTVNIGFGPQ